MIKIIIIIFIFSFMKLLIFSNLHNVNIIRLASNGYIDGPRSINLNNIERSYDTEIIYYLNYFLGNEDNPLYIDLVDDKKFQEKLIDERPFYFNQITANSAVYNYIYNTIKIYGDDFLYKKIPFKYENELLYKIYNPSLNYNDEWFFSNKRKFLIDRIKRFLEIENNFFWQQWETFKVFSPNITDYYDFNDEEQLDYYIESLIDTIYIYINSDITFKSKYNETNDFYKDVTINTVPIELVLSIFMRETKLFPFSFRFERREDYYGNVRLAIISLGLGQMLADADLLNLGENSYNLGIGSIMKNYSGAPEKFSRYDFEIITEGYFNNDPFIDRDLFTIRGSVLYTTLYLQLLLNKAEDIYNK